MRIMLCASLLLLCACATFDEGTYLSTSCTRKPQAPSPEFANNGAAQMIYRQETEAYYGKLCRELRLKYFGTED